jgi:YesN/AraC family two-component response regulator
MGEIFFNEDGKEYHLKKGDCFLFEPGKHHFGTRKSCYNLYYFHFKSDNIKTLEYDFSAWQSKAQEENKNWITENLNAVENSIIIPKTSNFADNAVFLDILKLAEKAVENQKIRLENFNTLCSINVTEMFIEIYRQFVFNACKKSNKKTGTIYLINDVIAYLNANFHRKLTSELIEKDLMYNFDYLNQLFRKNLGTTVFKFLEAIRIENAQKLLKTTNFSLEQIAENVGYKNEAYFSRVFKQNTGYSPSKYRGGIKGQFN